MQKFLITQEISKECQNYDIEIRLLKEKYNFLDQDYKETATELSIIKQEFQKLNEERESLFNEIRSLKQDNQILIRDRDRELKEKRVLNEENQKLNKLNYTLEEEIKSSKEENDSLFNEKNEKMFAYYFARHFIELIWQRGHKMHRFRD